MIYNIYFFLFFILIIMFMISINRKRIAPNSGNNTHNYITSPIDGVITDIHLVDIKENDSNKIFTEIIIQSHMISSPYLYTPISGTIKIIENNLDNFIVEIINDDTEIKISHGWRSVINQMNYPILKTIQTYAGDYFRASEAYGRSLFIHYIKILIPVDSNKEKNNTITAAIGQHVIGGESIIGYN